MFTMPEVSISLFLHPRSVLLRIEDVGLAELAVLLWLGAVAAEAGGHHAGVGRPAPDRRGGAVQIGQTVPEGQGQKCGKMNSGQCVKT